MKMMTKIHQLNDKESLRQQRNLTQSQRKNNLYTKEGVVVNSFVKDCLGCENNINETCDTLLISQDAKMPSRLNETPVSREKSLAPIAGAALGVMGIIAATSFYINKSTEAALTNAEAKKLQDVTRNVNLSKETHQVIYQIVHSPNKKTILAGMGVLTLSAIAFMGKTFFDGFKDVWIKKKEADIQKNLQEELIGIETQSFSGKMQIIRGMLAQNAMKFKKYLSDEDQSNIAYQGKYKTLESVSFKGQHKNGKDRQHGMGYFLMGAATVAGIVGFGFLSLKFLSGTKSRINASLGEKIKELGEIIGKSTAGTMENDQTRMMDLFKIIDDKSIIEKNINSANWADEAKKEFIKRVNTTLDTSVEKAEKTIAGSGVPKPSFNSFVDDYIAFCYNWLLDTQNKQFKQLFFGITGLTAATYGGRLTGEAIKDIQVKKMNAQTEVNLQSRLVSTELRNFKAKKDASIQPLIQDFYKQADCGKPKSELKTMAENILFEIKNGPPFVYS